MLQNHMASLSLDARFFAAATFTSDVKVGHVWTAWIELKCTWSSTCQPITFTLLRGSPLYPAGLGFLLQVHEANFNKLGEFQGTTKVMDLKVRRDSAGSTMIDSPG